MVEISLSGSGEGPGWETFRPTLQRMFAPAPREHPPSTLINALGPAAASRRSSVEKTWVPDDRLRKMSQMLLALKVVSPTLGSPLRGRSRS